MSTGNLFETEKIHAPERTPFRDSLLKIIQNKRYLPDHEAKSKSTKELVTIITKIESQKQRKKHEKI